MKEEELKIMYEAYFVFAAMWAFGGCIAENKEFALFNTWWRSIIKGVKVPEQGTCFDWFFDPTKNGWSSWYDKVPEFVNLGD
mmetsp:Transcript_22006/g.10351  ORF Transcript_22006/g.10351 Transcript_22006/m.10351 type:complete len:82 (+) Transcript_22006:2048-2293(+)